MHDPLTIWYAMTASNPKWEFVTQDIRVETAGQWTRGTCIVDRRGKVVRDDLAGDLFDEVTGDAGGWLDARKGNRVERCVESPGREAFAPFFLRRVFGEV
jgi:hypothetical protein